MGLSVVKIVYDVKIHLIFSGTFLKAHWQSQEILEETKMKEEQKMLERTTEVNI